MEREFSKGCSVKAIFAFLLGIIICAFLFNTETGLTILCIAIPALIVVAIIKGAFACVSDTVKRNDAQEALGEQYERLPQRKEIFAKVYGVEADLQELNGVEILRYLSDAGYEIFWGYGKFGEHIMFEMLLTENGYSVAKTAFHKLVKSLQMWFGKENCEGIKKIASSKDVRQSYSDYIDGLIYVMFTLSIPKDLNLDSLEQILRTSKEFADGMQSRFAHRQYDVDFNGRYFLTYRGLSLDSVIEQKWLGDKVDVEKDEFLTDSTNADLHYLISAIGAICSGRRCHINGFRDV